MRYVLISLTILLCPCLASAQQEDIKPTLPEWFDNFYEQVNQKVINPVRETSESLPQDIEKGIKRLLERIQEKKQQKQEEVKQEIKKEAKEQAQGWSRQVTEKIEEFLAPLKNKVQQGSVLIREKFNKVKDFFVGLFKE